MAPNPNLGDFFTENKKILKDYLDLRLEIFRLQMIKIFSKAAGYFIWTLISLFLLLLFMIFVFLTIGFWISDLTGSIIIGFAATTIIILVVGAVVALLRRILFVNPIIKNTVRHLERTGTEKESQKT